MAMNCWGLADTLKSKAAFQKHHSRPKKWTDRNLGVLTSKLNTSQQGAPAAGKTACLLGRMNANAASRSKKVVIHPYLAFVRLHLECRKFQL